jgi:oligopeptide transport system substrate-binding protein
MFGGGCWHGNFSKSASTDRKVFTYALDNPVTTLDPGKVQDIDMGDLLRNVFEGLVSYDENNRIVAQLAKNWKLTNHDRTYTFKIRPDAKFSDGTPVTASDFVWTWKRNLSKSVGSPVAKDYLLPIEGVTEFVAGTAPDIAGLKVIDNNTLSITLDKPRPYFLGELTYPCTFVMKRDAAGDHEITKAEQAIGTGPFKISRAVADQEIDLVPNDNYYMGKPTVQGIARPIIKDAATRLNKFRNGELDEVSVPREDLKSIQNDSSLAKDLQLQPRPAVFYFHLNERAYPPFKDARVRRAFAMALDRSHIVNVLLPGFAPAYGLLPPGMVGYRREYRGVPYDPRAAKKLLATTPYGGKLPPIELAYRDGSSDARIASTAAAESIGSTLGVQIRPRAYEWGTFLELRNHSKLQMAFSSWYADYLDPQNFLSMLLMTGAPQNSEGYSNPAFDSLCEKADVDNNPDTRAKLYQQAEDIAMQDVAKLPLYFQRDAELVSSRLTGVRSNLFGDMPHLKVELK